VRWAAGASAVIWVLATTGCGGAPVSRPNVIVVCIDSLRADRLAPYGSDTRFSRTLAEMARESVVFDRAYTVASWTKPSVASLLTGLYPSQHGLIASHNTRADLLPDAVTTLAERLKAAGYRTAAFVENVHLQRGKSALDQGFEVYAEEVGNAREILHGFAAWEAEEDQRPFFAYLHILDPHWPYTPLPPPAGVPLPDDIALRSRQWGLAQRRWPLLRDAVNEQGLRLAGEELAALSALYDGEIHDVDAAVSSLLELLRGRDVLERTLLVVTADHGEGFLEHARLDHGYGAYEELLRIPLVIRFPGARNGGARVTDPVQIVDVAPTILESVGVDAPAGGGRSLLGVLSSRRGDDGTDIVAEEVHGSVTMTALRTERYKYLRTVDAAPRRHRPRAISVPPDLGVGQRVRMEGISASAAFVADEVKRLTPGDEDCEITAPLAPLPRDETEVDVLGLAAIVSGLSAKERARWDAGTEPFVWLHLQGDWDGTRLRVDDVEAVRDDLPEMEIEGVIESFDVTLEGVSLLVCGRRVLVRADARWKDFAGTASPVPALAQEQSAPGLREELYDLVSDPREQVNLAGELPQVAANLASRLAARRAELLASVTPPEPNSVELNDDVRKRLQALGYTE